MDVSQYLEIFLDETKEHLQNLNTQILELEQDSENMDTVNEIFRAAHSLKGMAGTMGYKRMQNLTHDMENVFSEVRNGNIKVQPNMIDILFQCLDALEGYLANIQESSDEGTDDNEPLIKALNDILNGNAGAAAPAKEKTDAGEEKAEKAEKKDSASDSKEKWQSIKLTDTEKGLFDKAKEEGQHFYGITVYVQESCILKAARAFLVFKALEEKGEVVLSNPSTQDIEDEKFEFDFSVIVVTPESYDNVVAAIKSVSEIEDAFGRELTDADFGNNADADSEAEEEPAKEEAKPAAEAKKPEAKELPAKAGDKKPAAKPVVNRTVRVDIEKLDVLMNLVSELIIAKNSLVSSTSGEDTHNSNFNEQIEYLESVTTNLHESVMKVRMVPIESVVSKFPRMIRDMQKSLGKKMELHMTGEETELDRTVVDEIGDPLMHLLRNAADHGLESGEVRVQRGKPETGNIYLDAYQDGNNVVIEVRDDGNGIDVAAVKAKAIERGTITPEQGENMTDKEIIDLLFLPSFSTAKVVSDVSGRGVGLDVVKSKIEALGGDVSVKTKLGEGSTFSIRLPLTLAIIQALMVSVGGEKYAISLGSIQTIENITNEDIKFVEAQEVIHLRGSVIPLVRLDQILGVESEKDPDGDLIVAIVKKGDALAGLVVDELLGQQEIVIKSLGKYINCSSRLISGATILGDGEVALIIDANVLI